MLCTCVFLQSSIRNNNNQSTSVCFFQQRFRNTVNLLQQLSPDHAHPSLVVNLYSDERGYSLVLNPGIYMCDLDTHMIPRHSHDPQTLT